MVFIEKYKLTQIGIRPLLMWIKLDYRYFNKLHDLN